MRPAPLAPSHDHRDQLDLHAQPRRLQPVVRAGGSEPGRRDGRHRRRPRVRLLVRLPPPRQPEGLARMVTSPPPLRSEEHTSELQSLMRISYAVFCLKKKKKSTKTDNNSLQIVNSTTASARNLKTNH